MRAEHQRAFDAGCDDLIAKAGLIRTEDSRREAPSFRTRRQGHSSGTVRGFPRYSTRPEVPVLLSAPGPIRTGDLQVRSLTLYPAELRAQGTKSAT